MPARILHAHQRPDGYHFRVHLDTDQMEGDAPHPDWVREWSWGHLTPGVHQIHGRDMTEEEYHDAIEAALKEHIAAELGQMNPAHPIFDRFHGKEL